MILITAPHVERRPRPILYFAARRQNVRAPARSAEIEILRRLATLTAGSGPRKVLGELPQARPQRLNARAALRHPAERLGPAEIAEYSFVSK